MQYSKVLSKFVVHVLLCDKLTVIKRRKQLYLCQPLQYNCSSLLVCTDLQKTCTVLHTCEAFSH